MISSDWPLLSTTYEPLPHSCYYYHQKLIKPKCSPLTAQLWCMNCFPLLASKKIRGRRRWTIKGWATASMGRIGWTVIVLGIGLLPKVTKKQGLLKSSGLKLRLGTFVGISVSRHLILAMSTQLATDKLTHLGQFRQRFALPVWWPWPDAAIVRGWLNHMPFRGSAVGLMRDILI